MQNTKICTSCKIEKTLNEFYTNTRKNRKSGYKGRCKKCEHIKRRLYKDLRRFEIINTGTKICRSCKKEKSRLDFGIRRTNKDGRHTYCKECVCEKHKERYNKKYKHSKKFYVIEKKYGLSKQSYLDTLEQQKYKCAICKETLSLCVDHNHIDNKIRGLLCNDCNIGIGRFKDNPQFLLNAVDYLNYHAGRVVQENNNV